MKKYGNVTKEQEALLDAIGYGDLEEVKRLINGGCSPFFETDDGYTHSPIYYSIFKKDFEITMWLLDHCNVPVSEKLHHWASVVVDDASISIAIYNRLKKKLK
ncbi:MAG: hypothetical protein AAF443_07935 [Chlamydiota bacterium]